MKFFRCGPTFHTQISIYVSAVSFSSTMDIQIRWAIKVISLLVSSFQSSKIYNNHRPYHPPPTTTELTPCIIEALRSCSNKNQHRLWFDYHSIHTFVLFFYYLFICIITFIIYQFIVREMIIVFPSSFTHNSINTKGFEIISFILWTWLLYIYQSLCFSAHDSSII